MNMKKIHILSCIVLVCIFQMFCNAQSDMPKLGCPTYSFPFSENFEGYGDDDIVQKCWTHMDQNYDYPKMSTIHAFEGTHSIYFNSNSCENLEVVKINGNFNMSDMYVTFAAYAPTQGNFIIIGVVTDASNLHTYEAIDTVAPQLANRWERLTVSLKKYTGLGKYLAFQSVGNNDIYLDDIRLDYMTCDILLPTCETFESFDLGTNACWKNATYTNSKVIDHNPTDTTCNYNVTSLWHLDTVYKGAKGHKTFLHTGSAQTWSVPTTGTYTLKALGAQGGKGGASYLYGSSTGGKGGYAAGDITLNAGTQLTIYVGGQGGNATDYPSCPNCPGGNGGFGGGGGGGGGWCSSNAAGGGGGGGFSMIMNNGTALVVAGGGGGGGGSASSSGSQHGSGGNGGYGGGSTGGNGSPSGGNGYYGYGGTQSSGGSAGSNGYAGGKFYGGGAYGSNGKGSSGNGSTYYGGTGASGSCSSSAGGSGGGGGGWYGGGGGGSYSSGGGGGSSYVATSLSNTSNIGGNASMPDTNGNIIVGNSGNGIAMIEYDNTVIDKIDTVIDYYHCDTIINYHSQALLLEKGSNPTFVVSPQIEQSSIRIIGITFDVFCPENDALEIGYVTSMTNTASFINLKSFVAHANTWSHVTCTNIPPELTGKHLAFKTNGKHNIHIDNINFEIATSIDEYGNTGTTLPLIIIPNPASDYIELRVSDDSWNDMLDEVIIYNMFGKLIKSYHNTTSRISISDLANGVYIVKSGNAVGKFVKNGK